ncbi:MAG: carboxypeptidase regulatory-like domain-containing protein [Candidatus Hydrogenedentales bacterium]
MKRMWTNALGMAACAAIVGASWPAPAEVLKGTVKDADGKGLRGVMITALDSDAEKSVTIFTQPDGSYELAGLPTGEYEIRARLIGMNDAYEEVEVASGKSVDFTLDAADEEELEFQRPAHNLFSLLKWDDEADRLNFKMMCMYCHQVGTLGFRTPEEPVDWETMVRRMQGFGGLYEHTQETLVQRLLETYSEEAQAEWPDFVPPDAPAGKSLMARITEWDAGREDDAMIHDLELGADDKIIYTVDMVNDAVVEVNTETGERTVVPVPGGKDPSISGNPRKGPHSIERDADGNMWITLALSGEMAHYNVKTKEFTIVSSNEAPRPRGAYPHTLRIDQKGVVWYTDAGMNAVFSLDPNDGNKVKQYQLLKADQAVGGGRGESGGITPYGVSIAPDGMVWYTKLNGNRLGRIDPNAEDGDIKEWEPPFVGPRRHEVAPDGKVWVPGFANGVFASFDPETETWSKLYQMPEGMDEIPYALSVHPETGDVWICGTGSDTLVRFIPETEEMITYQMPSRVTYTREIEFAKDGSVWTCNSNYPVRHVEDGRGSVIKIEVADMDVAASEADTD